MPRIYVVVWQWDWPFWTDLSGSAWFWGTLSHFLGEGTRIAAQKRCGWLTEFLFAAFPFRKPGEIFFCWRSFGSTGIRCPRKFFGCYSDRKVRSRKHDSTNWGRAWRPPRTSDRTTLPSCCEEPHLIWKTANRRIQPCCSWCKSSASIAGKSGPRRCRLGSASKRCPIGQTSPRTTSSAGGCRTRGEQPEQ